MAEGWIKLHRKILDWEWWNDSVMVKVWLQLLFDANYEPKKWKGQTIERGQLIFGRAAYAEKCSISEQQVRTAIERLKSTSEITIKTTNRFSVVTITKYESYQIEGCATTNESTIQTSRKQPTNNQQTTTPKEVKNIDTKLNLPESPKHKSVFREDPEAEAWKRYYEELNQYLEKKKRGEKPPYPVKPGETFEEAQRNRYGGNYEQSESAEAGIGTGKNP